MASPNPVLLPRKKYSLYVPDLVFFGGSHTTSTSCEGSRSPRFQADCMAQGLRSLGVVEKCMVVGFSYGGFVGFQMAQHHPQLVGSLVLCGSAMALTQSISSKALERIGFSSWDEFLLPTSPQGVKVLLQIGSFKLTNWIPTFFYKHYLQVMFNNRKEREELLEAFVVRDEDVTSYQFQQKIHLLWGNEDKILSMEVANNLKEKLGGNTKLLRVKKAGHLAMLERPFVFNNFLKEILASAE